ncbi:MAG: lipoprotein-releasing ABC transporter permease subunit [Cypionkella sp.]|nr:lipoprotein-releasing ABC transporter permease subunit [Cypionkella sp.]
MEPPQPTRPFSHVERMIAWRYLRARRAEGGVSVMTWISLIGITLAVFALIATMAVRAGFRAELVDTILGANAHVTVYTAGRADESGRIIKGFADYDAVAGRVATIDGVTRAAPLVKGQVMVTAGQGATGAEVYGIRAADLASLPRVANGPQAEGDLSRFDQGIAVGSGIARQMGIIAGDRLRLIAPTGVKTAMGTSPRVNAYEVVYIFTTGGYAIDNSRIYMPLDQAQSYFNREGFADEIEVLVGNPETVDTFAPALMQAGGQGALLWTWRDSAGSYLRALTIEDNVMFVIMTILVLIATLNIVSGLIMLVKNKGRDIGILRTMGLTEGAVLRIFFMCGAFTGVIGTAAGVALGVLFAAYIDQIMAFVNLISGGEVWDPSIRGIYALPAKLQAGDVISAVALSLGLSFIVTIFPARRAARMNPVEALRYE